MTLTLELALPARILSPNGRFVWQAKSRAIKSYRTAAKIVYLASYQAGYKPRFKTAVVQFTWYAKTAVHPDGDNALASLKAGIDGLTDAGLFDDDKGLTYPPVIFAKDAKRPRIFVSITV